jgi:lysophospholipase L1-like esterase
MPGRVALAGALAAALLAMAGRGSGQQLDPRNLAARSGWLGTWFAASTGRVEPAVAVTLNDSARSTGNQLVVPPAVRAVAPDQPLPLGGQSPLHFNNQTLRQIVHITLGGARFRVVFSNAFGVVPLTIGAAHLAIRDHDAAIVPQTGRPLTFGGRGQATVAAGAILVSDPVDIAAHDFTDLAIDLYLPDDTAAMKSPITIHPASWQTNYVSPPGNHAGKQVMPVQTTTAYRRSDGLATATWFFLARVEVWTDPPRVLSEQGDIIVVAEPPRGAIVALGDSITDGTASVTDTNNRWPDQFARRLVHNGMRRTVLNAGIGGNRVLSEGNGPSALARFDRDVLAQPGVTHVIVLEGINDIGQGGRGATPSAEDLIAGHKQLIERAHAHGLKIVGSTLTPFEGAAYWTPQGEEKRQAFNGWIRTSGAYDAVVDFDAAVRDPQHPTRLQQRYDPGDHLHLNVLGYEALANAIDLDVF